MEANRGGPRLPTGRSERHRGRERRKPFNCFTSRWAPPKHKLPTLETLAVALREGIVGEERVPYNLDEDFRHTCKIRTDHWHAGDRTGGGGGLLFIE